MTANRTHRLQAPAHRREFWFTVENVWRPVAHFDGVCYYMVTKRPKRPAPREELQHMDPWKNEDDIFDSIQRSSAADDLFGIDSGRGSLGKVFG